VTADQVWPAEACEAVARLVAVWSGHLDKLPLYERGEFDAYADFRVETDAVLAALSVHAVPRAHMENLKHHTRVAFDAGMAENAALRADLVALQQAALDLAASFRGSGRMGEGDGYADELEEVVTRWLGRLGGVFPREMVDELRAAMNGTATKTGEDEPHA
jgi:hypothetical protein